MVPYGERNVRRSSMARLMTAGAMGSLIVFGTVGEAEAGLLDFLFGRPRSYEPPPFAYSYAPPPRRRAAQPKAFVEIAPMRMEATCCKNGEDPMQALLNDDTLMRGDVVMTPKGLRTFVGNQAPHSERDFVPIEKSQRISSTKRKQLLALDR